MNDSILNKQISTERATSGQKSTAVIVLHALALVLFIVHPMAGLVLLGTSILIGVGLSKPLPAAALALGLLWVNDVIADFDPFSRFTAWKDVLLLFLILGWMVRSVHYRRALVLKSPISVALLLVVIHFIVMCIQSPSLVHAILGLKATVFYMAWFFLIPDIVKTRRDATILIGAVLIGTLCISGYNIWRAQQPWGTFPPQRGGKMWPGPMQAHFAGAGYIIPTGLILAFGLIPNYQGWKRNFLVFLLGLSIISLLVTFLRANWVATFAAMLAMAVVSRRIKSFAIFIVLVLLIAPRLQMGSQWTVADRAVSTFDTSDESREDRSEETANRTIPFVLTHPLGTGTGSMTAVTSAQVWANTDLDFEIQGGIIHNSFLLVAIETGWTGMLCYIWFLFNAIWLPFQSYRTAKDSYIRNLSLGLFGVAVCFTVLHFFARMIVMPLISFMIWPILGLIPLLPFLDQAEETDPADATDGTALPLTAIRAARSGA